jgi:hypothetical protein
MDRVDEFQGMKDILFKIEVVAIGALTLLGGAMMIWGKIGCLFNA